MSKITDLIHSSGHDLSLHDNEPEEEEEDEDSATIPVVTGRVDSSPSSGSSTPVRIDPRELA